MSDLFWFTDVQWGWIEPFFPTNTPDSIVYTDAFKAYNALDVLDFQHRRIFHKKARELRKTFKRYSIFSLEGSLEPWISIFENTIQ